MLNHIRIRNYAIIDHLDLEFDNGLTALTGETGAGKSILLGALGLLLGDRADSDSVRSGSSKAEISAEFDLQKLPHIIQWLQHKELDSENDCLLRRRLSADGRSRAFINGSPVPLQDIRELGEMLVDIHGQHEHQSLMKPAMQRQLLDDYAGHKDKLQKLADCYKQWQSAQQEYDELKAAASDRHDRLDLLRYQVAELDALALQEGEAEQIAEEHQRLAQGDRLMEETQAALLALYDADENNAYTIISQQLSAMEDLSQTDKNLQPVIEMLTSAMVHVEESAAHLRDYLEHLDNDPARFHELEQRLSTLQDLSRKHQCEPGQLTRIHLQLQSELEQLDNADDNLLQLEQTARQLAEQYQKLAAQLSKSRQKAAKKLSKEISGAMQTLGMSGGQFEIAVNHQESKHSPYGNDQIEFLVSANPGQSCKPLAKTASGGELARISLAIQMITAKQGRIPTLIFDEVDSGVGGGIAEIVGQHLRTLGESRQVFCVTHLPQVAAQAHHHMQVLKQADNNNTITQIQPLDKEQRVEEIARMLGGIKITQQTRAHAKEMLEI